MAEKSEKGKSGVIAKRHREIRDAGQRLVFVGLDLPSEIVVKALSESTKQPPLPGAKPASEKEKEAELKRVLELLTGSDDDGKPTISVWVRVGGIIDGSPTKPDAVQAAIDVPMGRKVPERPWPKALYARKGPDWIVTPRFSTVPGGAANEPDLEEETYVPVSALLSDEVVEAAAKAQYEDAVSEVEDALGPDDEHEPEGVWDAERDSMKELFRSKVRVNFQAAIDHLGGTDAH
jgi:hypothetical protein